MWFGFYQYTRFSFLPEFDISDIEIYDSDKYSWCIDSLEDKTDIYLINGWVLLRGENIDSHKISVVIKNEDGSWYVFPTSMKERTDVTEKYNDESKAVRYDYDASGFYGAVYKRYVHSENAKIYILYQNNRRYELVATGIKFSDMEEINS